MFWRNREVKRLSYIYLLLLFLGLILVWVFPSYFFSIAIVMFLAAFISTLVVFRSFYCQITKLSDYLHRINSGQFNLEVGHCYEGELSILKSEILKTTLALSSQASDLKEEKTRLANSMSDISHQLKTPLTAMSVLTELLADPCCPIQERREFSTQIQAQIERLQWLSTSLLKLAQIDAGTIVFNLNQVPVEALFKKATSPLLVASELRGQKIHLTGEIHAEVYCDLSWTSESLLNVIKNCMEHTPQGGEINVHCFQNPLFTQLSIEDSGSGFPPEEIPYLFDRFFRGKNATGESVGIGLAMTKSIIQAQGGSIDAKNGEQGGALFVIKFFSSFHDSSVTKTLATTATIKESSN